MLQHILMYCDISYKVYLHICITFQPFKFQLYNRIIMEKYTVPANTRIGHVHLKVSDLQRSLDFYCGLLGFELITKYGTQAAFISAGGYHHHIGLNTWYSKGQPPAPASAPDCSIQRYYILNGKTSRLRFKGSSMPNIRYPAHLIMGYRKRFILMIRMVMV